LTIDWIWPSIWPLQFEWINIKGIENLDQFVLQKPTALSMFQDSIKTPYYILQESHRSLLNPSHPPGVSIGCELWALQREESPGTREKNRQTPGSGLLIARWNPRRFIHGHAVSRPWSRFGHRQLQRRPNSHSPYLIPYLIVIHTTMSYELTTKSLIHSLMIQLEGWRFQSREKKGDFIVKHCFWQALWVQCTDMHISETPPTPWQSLTTAESLNTHPAWRPKK